MMEKNEPGNNRYLKQRNQAIILNHIRQKGQVSRIELSRFTNLSATAIGLITAGLLEEGYIHEIGTAESTGGRKAKLLELMEGSYFSLGFDVDTDNYRVLLTDLTGKIYFNEKTSLTAPPSPQEVRRIIGKQFSRVLAEFSLKPEKVLGIGISIPGLVDYHGEIIVQAPNLAWQEVPFALFRDIHESVPVFIENEANASAICEHWQGQARERQHFICINISSGIGAGIFVNGKIYHGATGCAGEIGHNVVEEEGLLCNCGKYGCLETRVSPSRLVEQAKRLIKQGTGSRLGAFSPDNIDLEKIITLANSNDQEALMLLKESARFLGIGIAAIINTLNPEVVILGKSFCRYAHLVLKNLEQVIRAKVMDFHTRGLSIGASEFGDSTSVRGAAILPLQKVFSPDVF